MKSYNETITGNSSQPHKTLFNVFDQHDQQLAELFKTGRVVRPTLSRYYTTKNYFQEFLQEKFSKKDISLRELDLTHVMEFDHWLRVIINCSHNTVIKYIKNLRKIIRVALDYKRLENDPFKS